jgi:iron complex outermembrane receptor protein
MKTDQIKTHLAVLLSLFHMGASAQTPEPEPFLALALQEVMELEITSVSKKPQTISRSAAAVFVITSDDIRRAGAQNIPDALRLAPGLQVAQISANAWAVSARGGNGRFANKLLVMMDGRTVYSPLFSGTSWDVQDTILADIERIEVIRGPGAALWGANAVNGVINIITKSAVATQGTLVDMSAGTTTQGQVSLRHGGQLEGLGHWRLYGKAFENRALTLANGQGKAMDAWKQQRLGWRADMNPSTQDAVTVQSEVYQGTSGESALLNRLLPPGNLLQGTTQTVSGGHLLARWQRDLPNNNSLTMQTYFDHSKRDWPAHPFLRLDSIDADIQYRHRAISGHDMVVGAAMRHNDKKFSISTTGLPDGIVQYDTFGIDRLKTRMWSVMAQDDISLIPEALTLTLGSKFEKFDNDKLKPLPNARLLWTPNDNQTLWASASKAIRTPSLVDSHGNIRALLPPEFTFNGDGLPRPGFIEVMGRTTSEQLWAYEIGWKQRLAPGLTLDTAAYYNDYSQLRAGNFNLNNMRCLPSYNLPLPPGSPTYAECYLPVPLPNQYLVLPATLSNDFRGHSYGFEASLDWQASRQHRWQAQVTRFNMSLKTSTADVYSWESPNSSPKWSSSVRWSYTPDPYTELDLMVRHVGALRDVLFGQSVPSYSTLDMRWAWSSAPGVQWSVTGRNLMTSRHLEFVSEVSDVARTLIGPSVILGLRIQY